MENFVVSARKYRPDSFGTVVGQPSITRTLKNAIKTDQIAHAYLFCGPRGVGKTTCARIFAKTINCQNPTSDAEACNACESCVSFNDNRSFNIHELDAASNNSVDDIRNLVDQIRIPPQVGKFSIYIIDEVHMLSQQAFNAFLKTLEEPPAHAVFILATTEKHKIIPTILSRCQIFDFKRITVREIMIHLASVAKKESVEIDDTALNIIAQKADGSMRDALSIFDQVVSFSGKKVDYHSVIENLNVLDYEYYFKVTKAFLEGDYKKVLTIFDEVLENGFDARNYINGLGKHFRDLLMCKDEETIQLMELSGDIADQYRAYSKSCSINFLFKSLRIIGQTDINYKQAKDPRLHVEISLMKLSALIKEPGLGEAPVKVEKVEEKVEKVERVEEKVEEVERVEKKVEKVERVEKVEKVAEKVEEVEEKVEKVEKVEEKVERVAEKVEEVEEKPFAVRAVHKPVPSDQVINTGPKIKDFLNRTIDSDPVDNQQKEEVAIEEPQIKLELNQENLDKLWLSFANKIKEDQPRLYNTLTTQNPILEENKIVRVNMNNPLQEKAMNSIHPEILSFLNKSTGNEDIKIELLAAKGKSEKKLYTPEEKFKHMQEQNPQLGLFRKTFNLDFD